MRIPGTKRTARAPDGRRWRVGRRWTSTSSVRLRPGRRRREDYDYDLSGVGQGSDSGGDGGGSGFDLDLGGGHAGGGFDLGDLFDADALGVGLVILVVVGLLFFLLFPALEALIVLLLLAGGIASRLVLRRPWRVEARLLDGDKPRRRAHWEVVGFRRSGLAAREVAEYLAATGELPDRPPTGALPPS